MPITMSTESEKSVRSDGQPEALLECILALERSLNIQPQQSGPPTSQTGSSGTATLPLSTPNTSGDSGGYGLPQLAAKVGKTYYATMSNDK